MAKLIAKFIATGGGSGLLPGAPGTWGSLAALPFAWLIDAQYGLYGLALATLLVFLAGVWAAENYATAIGVKDPGCVVVDEVAGQWLALTPVALLPETQAGGHLWPYALAFAAFRLFDIVKPWPVRTLERLPGGWGIMVDDIAAGIYAAIVTYFALLFINQTLG